MKRDGLHVAIGESTQKRNLYLNFVKANREEVESSNLARQDSIEAAVGRREKSVERQRKVNG